MIRDDQGFTLLEMLVALALLGLLSVLLFGGLRFGARAWERVEAHDGAGDEIRHVQRLIRHQLERAYPLLVTDDPEHPYVTFEGGTDGVSFLAPALQAVSDGGNARVTLAAVRRDGTMALEMSAGAELAHTAIPRQEILLDRLRGVWFEYFGAGTPTEAPRWHELWRHRRSLPLLIRVRVDFAADDPRRWPDLVVAPRLTADAACSYDPATRDCRGR